MGDSMRTKVSARAAVDEARKRACDERTDRVGHDRAHQFFQDDVAEPHPQVRCIECDRTLQMILGSDYEVV